MYNVYICVCASQPTVVACKQARDPMVVCDKDPLVLCGMLAVILVEVTVGYHSLGQR